jgi:chromosome partitioning protein
MAVVVAFVSQKGGVRKSTLAREAAAGGLQVKVADLDPDQGTLIDWHRTRTSHRAGPVGRAVPHANAGHGQRRPL